MAGCKFQQVLNSLSEIYTVVGESVAYTVVVESLLDEFEKLVSPLLQGKENYIAGIPEYAAFKKKF